MILKHDLEIIGEGGMGKTNRIHFTILNLTEGYRQRLVFSLIRCNEPLMLGCSGLANAPDTSTQG